MAGDALRRIKFLTERLFRGINAPMTPHFDSDETTAWFTDRLKGADCYLEFGSGGSTYLAAQLGVRFATVESDRKFLDAVRAQIEGHDLLRPSQIFHHADIGPTGRWGRPLGRVDSERMQQFRRYSDAPTGFDCVPDLVLIDGRFRVACALKAMSRYPAATVIVDDFLGRPHYEILRNHADIRMVGRMAVMESWDPRGCHETLRLTETLPA
ncbi:hypothetical protein [Mycolicibacterium bacteremicum]|nr:hypothetical protein [Mycolicibacterium bacteremicum]MCV7431896.1 hypothetical protein [Mycolicibacterium bacteremicum]